MRDKLYDKLFSKVKAKEEGALAVLSDVLKMDESLVLRMMGKTASEVANAIDLGGEYEEIIKEYKNELYKNISELEYEDENQSEYFSWDGIESLSCKFQDGLLVHLESEWFSVEDIEKIMNSPESRFVNSLSLDINDDNYIVDDKAIIKLLSKPFMKRLEYLNLCYDCDKQIIDDGGMIALLNSDFICGVKELIASNNPFTGENWINEVHNRDCFKSIVNLEFNESNSGSEVISVLTSSKPEALKRLNLSYCQIDDEGLTAIAGCQELKMLEELDLTGNEVSNVSLRTFAQSTQFEKLKYIRLYECRNVSSHFLYEFEKNLENFPSLEKVERRYFWQ